MADLNLRRDGRPVVNIDVPAVVSQFLSELTTFDLVVELVKNDLDAGATRTEISFEKEWIECFGNGTPVDSKGWKRLAVILGAGTTIEAKRGGIGSKNNGLKSAFLFGDQIVVQSGGYRTDLTVRGDLERPNVFFRPPGRVSATPEVQQPAQGLQFRSARSGSMCRNAMRYSP